MMTIPAAVVHDHDFRSLSRFAFSHNAISFIYKIYHLSSSLLPSIFPFRVAQNANGMGFATTNFITTFKPSHFSSNLGNISSNG